jgi:outer membrane protein assembly factor BamB
MMDDRRDLLIRAALTPRPTLGAPADLGDGILAAIRATPQRRPRFGWFVLPTPQPRLALVMGALLLLALLIAIAVGTRQPPTLPGILSYHGPPERTGVMPGPGPAGVPTVLWTAGVGGPVDVLGMPLVSAGTVFVADGGGGVTAMTETSGTVLWTARPDRPGSGAILVFGGLLIHGSSHGRVTALDAATGATSWSLPVSDGGALSIASDGSILVVTSTDGRIYGVDPATHATRWTLDAGGSVARGAAIAGGIGFVGADSGRVTAFRILDGMVAWSRELGFGEIVTPSVDGGLVFIAHGFGDGTVPPILYALDVRDGFERWRWREPTASRLFVGAVEGDTVYALTEDGHGFAIATLDGTSRQITTTKGIYGALGAIVGGQLYLTSSDGLVVAFDRASGAVVWSVRVDGVPSAPAVIDGRVFIATDLGNVVAIGNPGTPTP